MSNAKPNIDIRVGFDLVQPNLQFYCGMGVLTRLGGQDAIGVNLSSNAYHTDVLPHPQPLPDALGRGDFASAKPGWGNADLDGK
ncbi:hypothetical protein NSTC745_03292 [Nostoc sp. DSM 114161]|uniref:hypothetical protein n=1 Tax=Nostoc sp. DSM 114161 TaxID=3440143 RepID=UPI0040462CAB